MAENARNTLSPLRFCLQFYVQINIPSFASSFHFLVAFSDSISPQFNAPFSTLRCYFSYFTRLQFIFYFNQSIVFIIPVLTTFLQLRYQSNDQNKSPFLTHPRAMPVAVSSCVVYYLAYIALLRYPLHCFAVAAYHCLVSSGYASVASLVSLLLLGSVSPFVYAVFVLLSASDLLYHKLIAEEEDDAEFWVQRRRVCWFLNNIWRVVRDSTGQCQQILPVRGMKQSGF